MKLDKTVWKLQECDHQCRPPSRRSSSLRSPMPLRLFALTMALALSLPAVLFPSRPERRFEGVSGCTSVASSSDDTDEAERGEIIVDATTLVLDPCKEAPPLSLLLTVPCGGLRETIGATEISCADRVGGVKLKTVGGTAAASADGAEGASPCSGVSSAVEDKMRTFPASTAPACSSAPCACSCAPLVVVAVTLTGAD